MKSILKKLIPGCCLLGLVAAALSCGGGAGSPDPLPSGTILVYGDSRSNYDQHRRLVSLMARVSPAAVFHTGDLVADDGDGSQWDTFRSITADLIDPSRFFPARGNHEANLLIFINNFPHLPNGLSWYSQKLNEIQLLVLDSDSDLSPGSDQYQWLVAALDGSDPNIKFRVVLFHYPIFTTGRHPADEKGLQADLVPLFAEHGVVLVFSGHNHCYERSRYGTVYYLVSGGGGAPLYGQYRSSPYSQKFVKDYHFCSLAVNGAQLQVEVFNDHQRRIDYFAIDSN